jgi:hypothetical protein
MPGGLVLVTAGRKSVSRLQVELEGQGIPSRVDREGEIHIEAKDSAAVMRLSRGRLRGLEIRNEGEDLGPD